MQGRAACGERGGGWGGGQLVCDETVTGPAGLLHSLLEPALGPHGDRRVLAASRPGQGAVLEGDGDEWLQQPPGLLVPQVTQLSLNIASTDNILSGTCLAVLFGIKHFLAQDSGKYSGPDLRLNKF